MYFQLYQSSLLHYTTINSIWVQRKIFFIDQWHLQCLELPEFIIFEKLTFKGHLIVDLFDRMLTNDDVAHSLFWRSYWPCMFKTSKITLYIFLSFCFCFREMLYLLDTIFVNYKCYNYFLPFYGYSFNLLIMALDKQKFKLSILLHISVLPRWLAILEFSSFPLFLSHLNLIFLKFCFSYWNFGSVCVCGVM